MKDIKRIDAALEGNWSKTITTIWNKRGGFIGFSKVKKQHVKYKPSIEFDFDGYWIGIHCYKRKNGKNVFDEKLAIKIIDYINRTANK